MKKTLLLFALFFTTISFCKFTLDNTYFYTRGVPRIVLENSGEKYYYAPIHIKTFLIILFSTFDTVLYRIMNFY